MGGGEIPLSFLLTFCQAFQGEDTMPQFSDDLFLGIAQTYMGNNANNNLNDPSAMDLGVGPLGRIYVWDVVPAAPLTNNVATAQTTSSTITLTAGTSTTSVINASQQTVVQLDTPRAVSITSGTGTLTNRTVTITGYDFYGQAMSEAIATGTVQSTTVNGKKAFYQILSASISGALGATIAVGTTDVIGCPVKIADIGYIASIGWDGAVNDSATVLAAVTTTPSTTTGDVRGTVDPSSACNGTKRLVVGVLLPALAAGPNATRSGALGVNQNLAS